MESGSDAEKLGIDPRVFLGIVVFVLGQFLTIGTKEDDLSNTFWYGSIILTACIFLWFLAKSPCGLGTKVMTFIGLCVLCFFLFVAIGMRSLQVG